MRKLASIQKILDLQPIPGADKIEVATILGWEVVVKKGEFKVGDLVVYCEVDSVLPERDEFEFLRERKFRIKTIKLRKQVSQGIAFPLSVLPKETKIEEDLDVTEILGVRKHDPQLQKEKSLEQNTKSNSKIVKFFLQFAPFRWFYFKLNKKNKGWPEWIQKTDEDRIQVCAKLLVNHPNEEWYITEKCDGQSGTFFVEKIRKWCISFLKFGFCSRNIRLKEGNNNYWKMVEKYTIDKKLLALKQEGIVVQGECLGQKIQKNKYKLEENKLLLFNVIENGIRYPLDKMVEFCNKHGFEHVPVLYETWVLQNPERPVQEIVREMVKLSIGKSVLNKDVWREGIVVRLKNNPNISFKVINPEFSLQHGDSDDVPDEDEET